MTPVSISMISRPVCEHSSGRHHMLPTENAVCAHVPQKIMLLCKGLKMCTIGIMHELHHVETVFKISCLISLLWHATLKVYVLSEIRPSSEFGVTMCTGRKSMQAIKGSHLLGLAWSNIMLLFVVPSKGRNSGKPCLTKLTLMWTQKI